MNAPEPDVPGLQLVDVVKQYGRVTAVAGVDLSVNRGEFLTVLGPSGSGKTTILRMIAGFVPVTSGRIILSGRDVAFMPPSERRIGMVFQNYALFPHLSALDNVAYGLKMRRVAKDARARKANEMLELVGLHELGHRRPRELSGGQQQRVALARALAFDPALLLMDEPLGALDRDLRIRMTAQLRRLHSELGTTVVYVTHDREEALTLSDRIAIMAGGNLRAVGTPETLYRSPATAFVASFFGGHNVVPAVRTGTRDNGTVEVETLGTRLAVTDCSPANASHVSVSIPSHAIDLAERVPGLPLEGEVVEYVYMGENTRVTFTPRGFPGLRMQANVGGRHDFPLGVGHATKFSLDVSRLVAVGSDEDA